MVMDGEVKAGVCKACGNSYDALKYYKDENPNWCEWVKQICTHCGYIPDAITTISDMIENGVSVTLTQRDGVEILQHKAAIDINDYIMNMCKAKCKNG